MKKAILLAMTLFLGGCGSSYGYLGGVFGSALENTWLDPERDVHKPAECRHYIRSEIYNEPYYGSYGTPLGSYVRRDYYNRKDCESVWIAW